MKTHVSPLICLHDEVHTHPDFLGQRESVGKSCLKWDRGHFGYYANQEVAKNFLHSFWEPAPMWRFRALYSLSQFCVCMTGGTGWVCSYLHMCVCTHHARPHEGEEVDTRMTFSITCLHCFLTKTFLLILEHTTLATLDVQCTLGT